MDSFYIESATQKTMVCQHCGHGFILQRRTPDGLTVANLRGEGKDLRHRLMQFEALDLRFVCANPKCNHVLEGRS